MASQNSILIDNSLSMNSIKDYVCQLAEKYGASEVSLFGSFARGDQRPDSDIDILLEKGAITGMQVFDFQHDIEVRFGRKVDMATTAGATERFLKRIEDEEILLYSNKTKFKLLLGQFGVGGESVRLHFDLAGDELLAESNQLLE